ncbi:unnamed protein product [Prunus armeniaca]
MGAFLYPNRAGPILSGPQKVFGDFVVLGCVLLSLGWLQCGAVDLAFLFGFRCAFEASTAFHRRRHDFVAAFGPHIWNLLKFSVWRWKSDCCWYVWDWVLPVQNKRFSHVGATSLFGLLERKWCGVLVSVFILV